MSNRALLVAFVSLLSLFLCSACKNSSGDDDNETVGTGTEVSTLAEKLAHVYSDFVPESLEANSSSLRLSGDPCKEVTGSSKMEIFLKCQPILLRAYLFTAKMFFEEIQLFVKDASSIIDKGTLNNGTSTFEGSDKITWKKSDSENFTFLIEDDDGQVFFHAVVNKNQYTLTMDGSEVEDVDYGKYGVFQSVLTYEDEDTWNHSISITALPCNTASSDDPEKLKILLQKDAGIWKGKAMTYHPWSGQSCTITPTDDTAMNIYTDFVGDDDAAKASVFMMARTVSSLSAIDDYAIGNVCSNFPQYCGGSSSSYATLVPNPYCNPSDTDVAIWGDECGDKSAAVKAAEYTEASEWLTPKAFYTSSDIKITGSL